MAFTDEDLKLFKLWAELVNETPHDCMALLARLQAAELKDCNQFHCGHATCDAWRKACGK